MQPRHEDLAGPLNNAEASLNAFAAQSMEIDVRLASVANYISGIAGGLSHLAEEVGHLEQREDAIRAHAAADVAYTEAATTRKELARTLDGTKNRHAVPIPQLLTDLTGDAHDTSHELTTGLREATANIQRALTTARFAVEAEHRRIKNLRQRPKDQIELALQTHGAILAYRNDRQIGHKTI